MNKPKRQHHVIPRLYLKGFVINPGEPFIWVYKRGEGYKSGTGKLTNNPFKDSINSAGSERDYYSNPGQPGREGYETFENELEALEKPANPIWNKIRSGQAISEAEKNDFAAYMIHLSRRVSAGRDLTNAMWPGIAEDYEPPDELYQLKCWPKTPETRLRLKAEVKAITQKPGHAIQMHRGTVLAGPESLMVEALKMMTWHIFKAPAGHALLTGDNPVFYDMGFGLASSFADVSLPLSTDLALVASWWKLTDQQFAEVAPAVVEEINRRTIHSASKHLYFSKSEEWVTALFGRADYKYRPMYSPQSNFKVVELVSAGPNCKPSLKLNVQLPLIPQF